MANLPRQDAGSSPDQSASERMLLSRRRRGVAALVIAIVVLMATVVISFDVGLPWTQGGAPATVRQLCEDEMHQDYVAVYQLLSSRFIQRYQLHEERFVESQQGRDQEHGPVRSCAIVGPDYVHTLLHFRPALRVTATLSGDHYTDTGTIELVYEHGWKIIMEEIDDILYLAG